MTANISVTPTAWTDEELADQAQVALEEFVERRLAEPGGKYLAHVKARRAAIVTAQDAGLYLVWAHDMMASSSGLRHRRRFETP